MNKHYYLLHIQYLGFRFHGWQKQKDVKTIHLMIDKTVRFVLGHDDFKTLGTSRTDALVSANQSAFELFLKEEIDESEFLKEMNKNLPSDIKITDIKEVDNKFNIINTPKIKEYLYLFSFGEKAHPFSSSLMSSFTYELDIELMKKGANLFLGMHNFRRYCTKPSEKTNFHREMIVSEIVENDIYKANFFPEKSYLFRIKSSGFMRNQVRLMMGQLLMLGRGDINLEELEISLSGDEESPFNYIAPASGLILNSIDYIED
ncbi:MAG: tRNA pseudouridine(38-40) synthase TruA [Bacteroidota bacterium]